MNRQGGNNKTVFIEDDIFEQQLSDEDIKLRERLRAEMRAKGGVTDEDIEKAKKEQSHALAKNAELLIVPDQCAELKNCITPTLDLNTLATQR